MPLAWNFLGLGGGFGFRIKAAASFKGTSVTGADGGEDALGSVSLVK